MSGIAVINAGSSSINSRYFRPDSTSSLLLRSHIESIGTAPRAKLSDPRGKLLVEESFEDKNFDHAAATQAMMRIGAQWLGGRDISAVGHRVVHGGAEYAAPLLLTDQVVDKLATLIPLAPLHQPHNLAPIRAILASHPESAAGRLFRHRLPPLAQAFAIPRKYSECGIRRYGFHGISYEYVTGRIKTVVPEIANAHLIIAHLGNGASLCAVKDGRSVASTMGFTAVDGLMMGTRCAALDPGVLIHLINHYGLGTRELEDLVYRKSGLLGVSGISSDMRALRASSDPAAKEAIDLFVYRIVREIGSLAAALGGIDALVFTGGIGENDAATRAEVGTGCAWLGLTLDEAASRESATQISEQHSRVAAFVIPTNEELEIATRTFQIAWRNA